MGRWVWLPVILILLVACQPDDTVSVDGPVLVQEVTIAPTDILPTRFLSPTPSPLVPSRPTSEAVSPLSQVTVDAQFVLVTPTLPPSKTPTVTPSQTPTPSVTPSATMTATASSTALVLPTSEIVAVTQPASSNADRICDTNWFFIEPRPESCPLNPPTATNGVYQEFQNGYMIWIASTNGIYIIYNDANQPRWEVRRDFFEETNPAMSYLDNPPNQIGAGWTPRRGFGLIWTQNIGIRNRLGYATQQWEEPFSAQLQTDDANSIFISTPRNFVFGLVGDYSNWQRYNSFGFGTSGQVPPIQGTIIPTRPPAVPPSGF
ncbi:MAG: hypothetical protein AAFV93_11165 [Chloroflexota bacterium]